MNAVEALGEDMSAKPVVMYFSARLKVVPVS
jgi:hypothetical protein